ncbi:MAG: RpiB/LacA/LacB family sugar-phosphate isomerase, partial [Spirochaetaceae bacterium]|nr:RpiB/LacA/LacB family sugar-phosphate isomerase [Spirochaetaceae bacterium]
MANDHGAVELKNKIISYLSNKGYEIIDFGV